MLLLIDRLVASALALWRTSHRKHYIAPTQQKQCARPKPRPRESSQDAVSACIRVHDRLFSGCCLNVKRYRFRYIFTEWPVRWKHLDLETIPR